MTSQMFGCRKDAFGNQPASADPVRGRTGSTPSTYEQVPRSRSHLPRRATVTVRRTPGQRDPYRSPAANEALNKLGRVRPHLSW